MHNWTILISVVHTVISIAALVLGLDVLFRIAFRVRHRSRELAFVDAAVVATATGFLFPFHGVTPALAIGVVSSAVLVMTWACRRRSMTNRACHTAFIAGLVVSEYLLCFVAVAQAFGKIAFLHRLAPTLREPAFGLSQALLLLVFAAIAVRISRRSAGMAAA